MAAYTQHLSKDEWFKRSDQHYQRVNVFAQEARERASRREKHPVYDFLTQYYPFSLGKFEKWHPGVGIYLEHADKARFNEKHYSYDDKDGCWAEVSLMNDKEHGRLSFIKTLLEKTRERKGVYSCFGLHEWAMVYSGADVRHKESAPLRLPQHEIDAVVASRPLVCTHFDAFRFFSPEAKPMNKHQPTLHDREHLEQPACIHVNMDLYKWAFKSMPWVGSDLVWRCFILALEARKIDMRASPYDISKWGCEPICIETEEGRVEYQKEQKEIEQRGALLRNEILGVFDRIL